MASPTTIHAFAALALNGVTLGTLMLAGAIVGETLPMPRARGTVGAVTVGLLGYLVFWGGFWHPLIGRGVAWSALGLALVVIAARRGTAVRLLREGAAVSAATTLLVAATTALMLLYPRDSVSATAAERFIAWMPGDNSLPKVLAEIVDSGNPTRVLGGDWLTSDRPPLQTGVSLLAWPLLKACGVDLDSACATAGIWFQALWFPVAIQLLRALGLSARSALGVAVSLGATGFIAFNTVYVWPKLGGAAFTVAAFLLWFPDEGKTEASGGRMVLGGLCAGCAWLSHGGVMFSLAALGPLLVVAIARHRDWRGWSWAAVAFALLAAPWMLYQKYYSPPGNRLVKWHIAGVIPPDARTVSEALRDRYREIGWSGALDARRKNLRMLFLGNFGESFNPSADAGSRRTNDIFFPLRTAAAWTLGLAGIPWLAWRNRRRLRELARPHLRCIGWLAGGLAAWIVLMFFPEQAFTHQGTFVTQLLLLCLLSAWAWLAHRLFFAAVAVVQWMGFFATWTGPSTASPVPLDWLAGGVGLAASAALLAVVVWTILSKEPVSNT